MDNSGIEVIHLCRPLACSSCCFPCCLQSLEVLSPTAGRIGSVEQEWTLCYPSFKIKNQSGDTMLRIEGPFCTFSLCGDVEFKVCNKKSIFVSFIFSLKISNSQIVSLDGTEVGKISKQWSGLAKEMFTDADNFGINFPMDLNVQMKAVMLGACMLIVRNKNHSIFQNFKSFLFLFYRISCFSKIPKKIIITDEIIKLSNIAQTTFFL